PVSPLPPPGPTATLTAQQTPESYLGYSEQQNLTEGPLAHDVEKTYTFPTPLDPDTFGLSGNWTDTMESANAGANAKLELNFQAHEVYLVLGGTGTVDVAVNGKSLASLKVSGTPRLYNVVHHWTGARALLTLTVSPGIEAYDFTFG